MASFTEFPHALDLTESYPHRVARGSQRALCPMRHRTNGFRTAFNWCVAGTSLSCFPLQRGELGSNCVLKFEVWAIVTHRGKHRHYCLVALVGTSTAYGPEVRTPF